MNDIVDARSVSSDEDSNYSYHDDRFFNIHMRDLIKSNDPSDKKNLNLMVIEAAQKDDANLYIALNHVGYQLQVLNDKGQTALHIAFYHGSENVLEFAMDNDNVLQDVHVNYSDCNGLTHLHIACDFWSEESDQLAKKYLEKGADVNARFEFDPKGLRDGFTPLHMCMVGPETSNDSFKLLLNYGADVKARDKIGRTPLHLLCSVYGKFDDFDEFDSSVRMTMLLERGSEVDARDDEGNTPMHSVFIVGCKEKFPYDFSSETMYRKYKLLRDHHADVTAINNAGNTVLHCVIMNLKYSRCNSLEPNFDDSLHVKVIDEIFSSHEGIDVNAKNNAGETFVQIAVSMLSADIVANLVSRNADVTDVTLSRDGLHCFYDDSIFLPNFETVNSVITIVSLLLDGGFGITDDDKLALVRFLLQDAQNDTWMKVLQQEKIIEDYLDNLMNFGTDLKIQRVHRPMTLKLLSEHEVHLKNKMHKYAKKWLRYKLKAGLYCDDAVNDILDLDCDTFEFVVEGERYFDARPNLSKNLEDERVIMETTYLNDNTTMLAALQKHPNDIYQRIKGVDLRKITDKFLLYKNIVEGHFTKCIVRNLIEKLVDNEYLKKLVFPALPDICCRMIYFYLDNEDILNVLSSLLCENQ